MVDNAQILKGILEGCILELIDNNPIYGYELALKLQEYGLEVSEGSIYPVLLRLQKKNFITGKMKKSPSGPNRKYYYLTEEGQIYLKEFKINWKNIKSSVDDLMNGGR
ncbi:PadR family transcriptional regulator [Senegalia massiliensis]|uniref:PadR family transcriptional regulator n=1 Tax=Senegalia massiliensis TaxID=1720316 RepID=A0A845QVG0_9CLOT|nr:PadR family transcriptional regulator [Senegalia massiliensis]NBI06221.1 PadR family transcriptional regulator [Senegalia massiliensis]